ncbi:hypothetical protein N7532_009797 [Penicillium argentinense]|uniref:Uncharacterized protein n=1 Tax=Penicillium argentinense TaxID=1131581 RepID=A0A9W9ENG5_9EURO|nr:uncharacterized protein N7532_009797 [Penicillium argentinense]KAJ5085026.1 hypothetical protein N7532_009797 [Penicillium argentinense]
MATTTRHDCPQGFADDDFAVENYDNYPSSFCSLENENLFPRSKFPMFRERDTPDSHEAYALLRPALLLTSRIITQCSQTFALFVRRRHPGSPDAWLGADAELELSKEEITLCIQRTIPNIDFDPDMDPDSSSFATTTLFPDRPSDLIIVDYNLIRLLKNSASSNSQKMAGLVFLAVLLAHELAHVLEFRSIRAGRLRSDGQPFETPAGVTCREAGTAWEIRAFGGRVYPVCQLENSLANMRGLCIKSTAWDFDMMKVSENWIRQLFTESHWTTVQLPLRPPIDKYARYALLEDELIDWRRDLFTKQKVRSSDVRVESGSPHKKPRSTGPLKTCGGKRVQMGPEEDQSDLNRVHPGRVPFR